MSGPPPPVRSGRREAILAAALTLFCERGFHAVGIDEIGTAAGISGPGVYRHFPSKNSLLVALLDGLGERMLATAEEVQKAGDPPEEALEQLIAFQVAMAVRERALLAVWQQDGQSLPKPEQDRLRDREEGYAALWEATLAQLRPDLGPDETRTVVRAALGAINSIAFHDPGLPPPALEPLLGDAARAVLATKAPPG